MDSSQQDLAHLVRDKYDGDASRVTAEDRERRPKGEPLAYVIGWIPFLGLEIGLDSKPLIPRPETEWWAELLIKHIGGRALTVLDLCAGSGAIGLAVLKCCPNARVTFSELSSEHAALIQRNLTRNALDDARVTILVGDLFAPLQDAEFNIIATNPPYVPSSRALDASVTDFEPHEALFAGEDGLDIIRRIAEEAHEHLSPRGELWLECDTGHAQEVAKLLKADGAKETLIRTDLYGRERLVLAYY